MSKHTMGPWDCGPSGRNMREKYTQSFAVYEYGQSNLICGCFGDVRGGEEVAEANARLIAAAPDLLAALKELADVSRSYLAHMDSDDIGALDKARAAIAKATGNPPSD